MDVTTLSKVVGTLEICTREGLPPEAVHDVDSSISIPFRETICVVI
jgi:hypothetical protein